MSDSQSVNKCLPFRWYGGKYSHLDWILPQLPSTNIYVEPFGGSGATLLNRKPSPVEVYNDLDNEVTNFFQILREQKDELLEKIGLTPFSRKEFEDAIKTQGKDDLSDLEKARTFFVRAGQVRSGLAQEATPGRWAYCKSTSRRGMAGAISRWHTRLDHLEYAANRLEDEGHLEDILPGMDREQREELAKELDDLGSFEAVKRLRDAEVNLTADRFRRVQIENKQADEVIDTYDSENTLFYCDPPYPHSTRHDGARSVYRFEMSDEDHCNLAEKLHGCEAKVAISSYRSELTEDLYSDWNRIDIKKVSHTSKKQREESLWLNYSIPEPDQEKIRTTIRIN